MNGAAQRITAQGFLQHLEASCDLEADTIEMPTLATDRVVIT